MGVVENVVGLATVGALFSGVYIYELIVSIFELGKLLSVRTSKVLSRPGSRALDFFRK